MSLQINPWLKVGEDLRKLLEAPSTSQLTAAWEQAKTAAYRQNAWFRPEQTETALSGIVQLLNAGNLQTWAEGYEFDRSRQQRNVGVIMAGNIPMAGFHDLLCVSLSGHNLIAKPSSDDPVLLPFIKNVLSNHDPEAAGRISFAGNIRDAEAIIATGSNNTSRYFEYYFGNRPHIFRKNRNSAAVLTGEENEFDLILLGKDIFTFFGLGCRNVSKLYVPKGYDFGAFFDAMKEYAGVMEHNKYMNDFDYNQAVYLLNNQAFLTNNFLILIESEALSSPVSVVFHESYHDESDLQRKLDARKNELQCIVSKSGPVPFGRSQMPDIGDYADGIDTMEFLLAL